MEINMKYKKIVKGIFKERPNRFIAHVEIDGKLEVVHVKNTGRCREILKPGVIVYLEESDNPNRKTKYDLVAAVKEELPWENKIINIDSQVPNQVAEEWLKKGNIFSSEAVIKREVTYGESRFDFYIEDGGRKAFLEVKGVTLEYDGKASFPDAPTLRGVKHINELMGCMEKGYEAHILFVIQMKGISTFSSNDITHPEFGQVLRQAKAAGVKIVAMDCEASEDGLEIRDEVRVVL